MASLGKPEVPARRRHRGTMRIPHAGAKAAVNAAPLCASENHVGFVGRPITKPAIVCALPAAFRTGVLLIRDRLRRSFEILSVTDRLLSIRSRTSRRGDLRRKERRFRPSDIVRSSAPRNAVVRKSLEPHGFKDGQGTVPSGRNNGRPWIYRRDDRGRPVLLLHPEASENIIPFRPRLTLVCRKQILREIGQPRAFSFTAAKVTAKA